MSEGSWSLPDAKTPPARVQAALIDIYRQSLHSDEPAIYALAVAAAVAVTGSEVAYLHLVNADQESIEFGTWSAAALAQCHPHAERHYPLRATDRWARCVPRRQGIIDNAYPAEAAHCGQPLGPWPLFRHLAAPVISGGRVTLLLGVGNKAGDYDQDDLDCVQAIADHAWILIGYRRRLRALEDAERQFIDLRHLAGLCLWQWDPVERELLADEHINRIFRLHPEPGWQWRLDTLLRFIDTRDHPQLLDLFRAPEGGACFDLEVRAMRADATPATLHLHGLARPRSQGHGVVLRGVLQDISERLEAEQVRFQAMHDALTGLANRRRLMAYLDERLANGKRRPADHLALLFIDLDRFKPVNDTYGHAVGDEVLKLVAKRLLRLTRKEDLVARIGGDEMVVVQQHVSELAAAEALAAKIVSALEEPMPIGPHQIGVGASVGIVLAAPGESTAEALLAAADAAMYRVKQRGRGGYGT